MKRFLLQSLCILLLVGCARHKIIPDDKLALIFRDAFLANAYFSERNLKNDSMLVYEPIFASYGYTTDDVQYTIGNFSKRKSARLGDVVERAIDMLETQGAIYDKEVSILDTIDHIARRTFTRKILSDTLVEVRRLKDTVRLRWTLDSLRPGEYAVRFDYRIDSTDANRNLRGGLWMERADSSRTGNYTVVMRRERDEQTQRTFKADTSIRRLVIDLWQPRGKRGKPAITVRNLEVRYTPPTDLARESLYLQQLDLKIFADDFLRAVAADSLP